jgi:hypothetical protein
MYRLKVTSKSLREVAPMYRGASRPAEDGLVFCDEGLLITLDQNVEAATTSTFSE